MKPMSMQQLLELTEWMEEHKKQTGVFYTAKYFHPCIDTRFMECFAIEFRAWFGRTFKLDFRDKSDKEFFFDYVKKNS